MKVVKIRQRVSILQVSVNGVSGNAAMSYGRGGSGPARVRSNGGSDMDESEDWYNWE